VFAFARFLTCVHILILQSFISKLFSFSKLCFSWLL